MGDEECVDGDTLRTPALVLDESNLVQYLFHGGETWLQTATLRCRCGLMQVT